MPEIVPAMAVKCRFIIVGQHRSGTSPGHIKKGLTSLIKKDCGAEFRSAPIRTPPRI